ncbi:Septin [Seminavis robusta]|uniref:Septin n=1 Tax=Seminavis robusta TaxID=568900 RepID=A0A9N8H1L0_9STRA|nr:Septin [Seminavis robusta]|eukprot:Sro43_g026100.1 Septin (856) ;mRNA; f:50129-52696
MKPFETIPPDELPNGGHSGQEDYAAGADTMDINRDSSSLEESGSESVNPSSLDILSSKDSVDESNGVKLDSALAAGVPGDCAIGMTSRNNAIQQESGSESTKPSSSDGVHCELEMDPTLLASQRQLFASQVDSSATSDLSLTLEKARGFQRKLQGMFSQVAVCRQPGMCSDTLSAWCCANGVTMAVSSTLRDQGAESFSDLLSLSQSEKDQLIDEMDLKVFARKKVARALSSDMLGLYNRCILQGKSAEEFNELSKQSRQSGTQLMSTQERETKVGNEDAPTSSHGLNRPMFPPGLHVVPHKIITLDREKTIRDNPRLTAEDFISLTKDRLNIPPGGELKVALFVGSSGCGKSTTINSYVNYLYGVRFEDPFRLNLVDEPPTVDRQTMSASQTHQVLGYLLKAPPALGGKHWILIIDTPGFGDTRGLAYDMNTVDQIRQFFMAEINYLHAVCLVVKGTETKLDSKNRWIFDQVLSLFGKDIREIITLLMTFSDAAEPPAMTVINDARIEYNERFKLNNSAFFLKGNGRTDWDYDINHMFWKAGNRAFEAFSNFVLAQKEKSLAATKDVLDRREELKAGVESVRRNIDLGMVTLEKLDEAIPQIVKLQSLIDANKEFEIEVTEMELQTMPKKSNYNTVCENCSWTCHINCAIKNDDRKMGCAAMDRSSGHCKCCPNKCHWSDHRNLDYYYERVPVKKKQTNQELYGRYVSASSDKSKSEQLLEGLRTEFTSTQVEVYDSVHLIQSMINELQRIALRPSLYHEDEYFDIMIDLERKEKQCGWKQRVKMIEEVKQRSKFCSQVESDGYDPFAEKVARLEQQARQGQVNVSFQTTRPQNRNRKSEPIAKKSGFFMSWFA